MDGQPVAAAWLARVGATRRASAPERDEILRPGDPDDPNSPSLREHVRLKDSGRVRLTGPGTQIPAACPYTAAPRRIRVIPRPPRSSCRKGLPRPAHAALYSPVRLGIRWIRARPSEGQPFRRGATVFENSTACTLFDRPSVESCVQVRHRRMRGSFRVAGSTVPRLTSSCASEPLVYIGLPTIASRRR